MPVLDCNQGPRSPKQLQRMQLKSTNILLIRKALKANQQQRKNTLNNYDIYYTRIFCYKHAKNNNKKRKRKKKQFLQRNFRINWETLKRVTTKFSQRPSPSPSPSRSRSFRPRIAAACSPCPLSPTCPAALQLLCRKFCTKKKQFSSRMTCNWVAASRVELLCPSVRPSNRRIIIIFCSLLSRSTFANCRSKAPKTRYTQRKINEKEKNVKKVNQK